MLKKLLCSTLPLLIVSVAQAHEGKTPSLPTGHAPIGVMGDHTHKQGEWMAAYRYGTMEMSGIREGTSTRSTADIHSRFMMAPEEMRMEMHMVGMMYGATNQLTLTAMAPYIRKEMQAITRSGMRVRNQTEGLGDIKVTGLYTLFDKADDKAGSREYAHLNLGLSLPTGSIDERGTTPMMANARLPYGMQLGSGTIDPRLGVTYVQQPNPDWSWGAQASSILRFGKNSEGYRLGNEYAATLWAGYNLSDYVSVSARLNGTAKGNIRGQDNELNPTMAPMARADMRGGERVEALLGVNLLQPTGPLADQRLAVEIGTPIYENLDGPQLEQDYRLTLGWQAAF